jgi:hypothetical protein
MKSVPGVMWQELKLLPLLPLRIFSVNADLYRRTRCWHIFARGATPSNAMKTTFDGWTLSMYDWIRAQTIEEIL